MIKGLKNQGNNTVKSGLIDRSPKAGFVPMDWLKEIPPGNSRHIVFPSFYTIFNESRWLLMQFKQLSMKHEFTQLQLTRLVYGETTKAETDMLLELASSVPQIASTLETLQMGRKALGEDRFIPSDRLINRILGYSASSAPVSAS